MNLEQARFLISETGQTALAGLNRIDDRDMLSVVAGLRSLFTAEEASALVQTTVLRLRGKVKFERADEMLFTEEGLQQATAEPVSRYRAERFRRYSSVYDLGCGIGGDAIALGAVSDVTAIDLDPVRAVLAEFNASVHGVPLGVEVRDLLGVGRETADAYFCDPARRDERGKRILDPSAYRPPLGAVIDRFLPELAVKTHPAIADVDIPADSEAEFVSLHGELRECVLWFGAMAGDCRRRATLLPSGATLVPASESAKVDAVGTFIYEPDPAVIRAGLVKTVAAAIDGWRIDPSIAYISSEAESDSSFVTRFRVEAVMPFSLKRIRAYLRAAKVGVLEIKKRGSPIRPEQLRKDLKLSGDLSRVLFVTRVADDHTAIIARRE